MKKQVKSKVSLKPAPTGGNKTMYPAVYKTHDDVVSAIDILIEQIGKSRPMREFFKKALRDLASLRERFANNETRIAIIGITSSGKSTLMNAVLGGNLLPTRVGPSSSKQVLCGWDEKREAEIIFDAETGKNKRVLTGSDNEILKILEQYGDEKYNPKNREGVDEIRVHAPAFRFNKDLVIIDTPGLDAYGLDQHKEVTMKLVLPTVDMILFLTNVKCDSDGKNLEFIDKATTDDKPLVVVQNKIDAIEAKISKKGVDKTVDEIRLEHRRRLERLLANAKKESVRNAPIVQVSAKSAWKHSNLAALGDILDEQVRINSDFRAARRFHQFTDIVSGMRDALESKLAESKDAQSGQRQEDRKLSLWASHVDELSSCLSDVDKEIKRRMTAISDCCENLLRKVAGEDSKKSVRKGFAKFVLSSCRDASRRSLTDDAKKTKRQFEQLTRELNEYFSAAITETQNKVRVCCTDMGMDERQTVRSTPFRSQHVSISDGEKTRRVKEEYEVDKGCGFLFWRSLCGCRYETKYRWVTETYVDVKALVEEINKSYSSFVQIISGQQKTFSKNYRSARDILLTELNERKETAKAQRKQTLPVTTAKKFLKELHVLSAGRFEGAGSSIQNAVVGEAADFTSVADVQQEMICSPEVLAVERLAHALSFESAYSFADDVVRRSGKDKTLVCGWDGDKLKSFREWFFRSDAKVDVVDFSSEKTEPDPDSVVFLLVNAEQSGSFRGKLFGGGMPTRFIAKAAKTGRIVWVMDSVREHVGLAFQGDALIEAYIEMLNLAKEALGKQTIFDVMACDRHLYWSVLFHELYFNTEITRSETCIQQFVDRISKIFKLNNARRHATGKYVTDYNALNK